ncbi:transcriptional regulator, BadM/Rrf2 family [Acidocella aminolytica 101 = DSM 11237]|jgi:Rrf2 family nitric oxide-sensitive transcriptional repressor|uniref:Transcriptional regulator BadM/Rrf16 n=2 Tax=Acidocella TaxID=50709 RepID=A0A0D6PDD2_9PROT|nr:Rrf2 family transcriptional regulator [Acidocella aminolytica]GAN79662.1 transcriptional regulator BadM/Rrf16 [Acidocella aminolytica 101 = DSM 11237]GBQ41311.1 Rrf2 family transcriptional regulator [Acidocella aminolytica 101 = DSM 11237]SHF05219.1 transcriptional regulator, BadM/Rrf2 family [Acidocella aminolytica 101 = DSM 11237]
MRLTQFSDYAVRVVLYLATHADRLCSIHEIAQAYGISQNHLMKVVSDLAGAEYIHSLRGRGGGIRLARPAAEINIGQLLRHTEGQIDLVGCGSCILAPACGMTCALREAVGQFFLALDRYSLADIIAKGRPAQLRQILTVQ